MWYEHVFYSVNRMYMYIIYASERQSLFRFKCCRKCKIAQTQAHTEWQNLYWIW